MILLAFRFIRDVGRIASHTLKPRLKIENPIAEQLFLL